jgi:hypothetical protein
MISPKTARTYRLITDVILNEVKDLLSLLMLRHRKNQILRRGTPQNDTNT